MQLFLDLLIRHQLQELVLSRTVSVIAELEISMESVQYFPQRVRTFPRSPMSFRSVPGMRFDCRGRNGPHDLRGRGVLEWLQGRGKGYLTMINRLLRRMMEQSKSRNDKKQTLPVFLFRGSESCAVSPGPVGMGLLPEADESPKGWRL